MLVCFGFWFLKNTNITPKIFLKYQHHIKSLNITIMFDMTQRIFKIMFPSFFFIWIFFAWKRLKIILSCSYTHSSFLCELKDLACITLGLFRFCHLFVNLLLHVPNKRGYSTLIVQTFLAIAISFVCNNAIKMALIVRYSFHQLLLSLLYYLVAIVEFSKQCLFPDHSTLWWIKKSSYQMAL